MIPSTYLAVHKVDNDREYMGQPTMSKENIINLNSFNQYCQVQANSGSLWLSLWLSLALVLLQS